MAGHQGALQLYPGRCRHSSQEGTQQCVSVVAINNADNADWGMAFSIAGVAGLAAYAYLNRVDGEFATWLL